MPSHVHATIVMTFDLVVGDLYDSDIMLGRRYFGT